MNEPSPFHPSIDGLASAVVEVARTAAVVQTPEVLSLLGQCISHLHDIVVITEAEPLDMPGPRIVFVNQAFERTTGYQIGEVLGGTPRMLHGPQTDEAELRRVGAALRRWEVVRSELINYKKSGETYVVEMEIVPVRDDTGRYTHWISVQRDVTSRKRAESLARLREAQRTESLGTLAAGVAHDFNNIIAAILGNVAIAQHDIRAGGDGLGPVAQIGIAGQRARKLVQQILAYSRRQPQAFAAESLTAIVIEACDLLRAALPAGASLKVTVTEEPLTVSADAMQIQQVLLNLGTNAWHAMNGGPGRIDVDCRLVTEPTRHAYGTNDDSLEGHDLTPTARWAVIRMSDTGCGMDAATRERVFEPYFTTKPIGHGTGLGLSVAWGIIASHGATISVESELGQGTCFEIRFPLVDPACSGVDGPMQADPPAPVPAVDGGVTRLLLVDDDDVVLLMLENLLTRSGFQVVAYNDPAAALEAVRSGPDGFDVVVTDYNMPNLSGVQLTSQLVAIAPHLPVLIGSGFVDGELTQSAAHAGAAEVFNKEFAAESLDESVRRVLRNRPVA